MAGNERFDDTIGRWLEEAAPTRLPGRVLEATFERTRRTRQEPGIRAVRSRYEMPRLLPVLGSAALVAMAAVLALNIIPMLGPGGTRTPTPSAAVSTSPAAAASPSTRPGPTAPPIDAEVAELLSSFLEARVAGVGAEQYLEGGAIALFEEEVPLLYATTSGAPYDRADFEQVLGYDWPYGFIAFKVRLFAGETVVEQLFFTPHDLTRYPDPSRAAEARGRLVYVPDGYGTDIAPTTENGRPVARPYDAFGGEVTLPVIHPWVFRYAGTSIGLVPQGAGPTTDGGERNGWYRLTLLADPGATGTGCRSAGDAQALAESIRSHSDREVTDPVSVTTTGGVEAVMIDVLTARLAVFCNEGRTALASGDRMRLYLFDLPERLPSQVLVIAIVAAESDFERAVVAAARMIDGIEFHAP